MSRRRSRMSIVTRTVLLTAAIAAIAVVVALVFSFVVSFIILKLLDATMGLRVSATDEQRGLDLVLHEEQSYVLE